jgi:rubrerythrin
MIEDSATSRTLLTAPVATAAAMCVGTIADISEARAAEVDPIFTAIKAERAAFEAYARAAGALADLEANVPVGVLLHDEAAHIEIEGTRCRTRTTSS